MTILGTITPELYWEWRCVAAELNLSKKELESEERKFILLQKELEISRLNALIFKQKLEMHKIDVSIKKKEYDETKKKLEEFIGKEMPTGSVINEKLEIVSLDNE